MIYSYNKSQQDALFLNFILVKNSTMFRADLLSIIRSLNTLFTAIGICHASYVGCLQIPNAMYRALIILMMDSRSVRNM